ncbi:MAG: hypothetical protein IKQ91_08220 [Oscillospiraceae bacterium]|nr:hypothetical protein [Oscillospiraceae bacterium]
MAMGIQPEALIAEYCDLDSLSAALRRGEFPAVRVGIEQTMQKILAEKPDEETLSLLVNCLFVVLQYHIFYGFLDEAKLSIGDTYAKREAMRRDWDAWKQGQPLRDDDWLSDPDAREMIFEAIDALRLTADDFDEIPAPEMKEPKWHRKTYGDFELVTIADAEITDDGGFSKDPDPTGKSYVLHDADGVTYYLNNIRKSQVPGGLNAEEAHLYTADGWIDGYTGRELREIEFEYYDGGYVFSYTTDGVNDAEAGTDPRWMPYETWVQGRIAKRRAQQAAFLAHYL